MHSRLSSHSSPLRLGLIVAQSGPAGLWSPSAIAAAELAVSELNDQGGILGRQIEVFARDCGAASGAVARDCVDAGAEAIIGMFPSYGRADVIAALQGEVPFLYTPQFEGGERDPGVITTGETTEDLLRAALHVIDARRPVRRVFLCGSDYRWPRESFAVARRLVAEMGAEVVGAYFQPLGDEDHAAVLDRIAVSGADTVIPMYLGLESVVFNRAFAEAGLSTRIRRCVPGFDETMLYGLGPDDSENLFAASSYFAGQRTRNNGAFLERYYTHFGDNPPPTNAYGQSVYEGIYTLAALMEQTRTAAPNLLRRHLGRVLPMRSARHGSGLRPVGSRSPVLVAEARGYDLDILASAETGRTGLRIN